MKEKELSAVSWLRKELLKKDMDKSIKELFEQAEEMHKEQIEDAYVDGAMDEHGEIYSLKRMNEYYNQTFKSE